MRIVASCGTSCEVSPEDYQWASSIRWTVTNKTVLYFKNGSKECVAGRRALHRMVAVACFGEIPDGLYVDHADRNPLNNRRDNIRLVSSAQNNWNRSIRSGKRYKGISLNKRAQKWVATIGFGGKGIYLGRYNHPQEAALVYDHKARELYGSFAVCNYPDES